MAHKGFRLSDDVLKEYEELKQKENIKSDSDFFAKMLDYTKKIQYGNYIPVALLETKDKELKSIYIKLGEFKNEIDSYRQQKALPKKPFWKRLFGGRDS